MPEPDGRALCDGDRHGESDRDMDELNDSSTSIGRSVSVFVGEGLGDEKHDEGDSMGEDEKLMLGGERASDGSVSGFLSILHVSAVQR